MSAPAELVAIVGAGPAGLAAGAALARSGIPIVLLDTGSSDISSRATSRLVGLGGAGLYSDGKFSFRPSATRLWELQPGSVLEAAEEDFLDLFERHGGHRPIPLLPTTDESISASVTRKRYPSVYLSFEQRAEMIRTLSEECGTVACDSRVSSIEWNDGRYELTAENGDRVSASALIIATGRLGPTTGFGPAMAVPMVYRRGEIGIRIETEAGGSPLDRYDSVDPKLIGTTSDSSVSWRTFCMCRDGLVESSRLPAGGVLYSGRADCPPTGRSNFGLLVRVDDEDTFRRLRFDNALSTIMTTNSEFDLTMRTFIDGRGAPLDLVVHREVTDALLGAIDDIFSGDPGALDTARAIGPCVEGVGMYPDLSNELQTPFGTSSFVCGDASGIFRGLAAALVSGFFVGRRAAEGVRSDSD